jgi:hypothetical protein
MKFYQLLVAAEKLMVQYSTVNFKILDIRISDFGAKWMFDRLNEVSPDKSRIYDKSINFLGYGIFKYGLAIFISILYMLLCLKVNLYLLPILLLVFYCVEVHFLFLFPILFDSIKSPIFTSLKCTYILGLMTAIWNVIPIGIFMLFGLMNFKKPYRNWLIGCIAILIWYRDEIRDRI